MRNSFRVKEIPVAAVFLTLLSGSGGCDRQLPTKSDNAMDKSSPRIEKLFEETKAICFGRVIINVPRSADVIFGWTEVDSSIQYEKSAAYKVEDLVKKSLRQAESEREYLTKDDFARLPLFGKVIDGIIPGQKIVLGSKDGLGYSALSFVPIGEDLFVQSYDSLMPEENIVERLNLVAKRLRSRLPEEIPAEEGICIEGGFVSSKYVYERARIGVRLKEFPDVHLSIEAHKNLMYLPVQNSPRLLRRSASERASNSGLASVLARVEVLRDQERQLSVWMGEEFGARTPHYKKNNSVHEFRFHSAGSVDDHFHPELDIRLDSGVKGNTKAGVKPSITDEEALALWDKILPTVHLRQASDARPAARPVVKEPLGSTGKTGDACPESGWWECVKKGRTDEDRRRFFVKGETMPPALVAGHVNLWRFLIGDVHRIAAVTWKLIEYDGKQSASSPPREDDIVQRRNENSGDEHA